jgi:hypothetical protein
MGDEVVRGATDDVVLTHEAQEANRRWWDAAVPVHLASALYDVGRLAGRGPWTPAS